MTSRRLCLLTTQRLLDHRVHLVAEPLPAEPLRVSPDVRRIELPIDGLPKACRERLGRSLVDEDARLAGYDGFECAPAGVGDDGPAARLSLDRNNPEIFFAGKHHGR